MQQADDTQNITHEHLLRYVFRQLSPEEESRIEDFLDSNPHEADIVEGILQFCKERGIRNRESFEEVWREQQRGVQERIQKRIKQLDISSTGYSARFNKWGWAAVLFSIIISGAIGFRAGKTSAIQEIQKMQQQNAGRDSSIAALKQDVAMLYSIMDANKRYLDSITGSDKTGPLPKRCRIDPSERKKWFGRFIAFETSLLTSAGESESYNWRDPFLEKKDWIVIQLLQEKANKEPEDMAPREYYVLGAMYLLKANSPADAVHYLEKAGEAGRPDYKKMLLAAYLENEQYVEAKSWAKQQNIPQSQWPIGLTSCLE
ncbi:MAG: hypothetical protein KF734_11340 [Saprospiraceae bacterium]|nr:hypothetical protein [Saprospiraceae bacterium]